MKIYKDASSKHKIINKQSFFGKNEKAEFIIAMSNATKQKSFYLFIYFIFSPELWRVKLVDNWWNW